MKLKLKDYKTRDKIKSPIDDNRDKAHLLV